jgi:hypothetical protein
MTASSAVAPSVLGGGSATAVGANGSGSGAGSDGGGGGEAFGGGSATAGGKIREIGGRTERLGLSASSVRFAFGFGSSISETVSTGARGVGGGVFSVAAGCFAAVGAGPRVVLPAAGLALLAFSSDAALDVLRAAGAFRAAVFVLVVRVGISCF